MRSLRRCCIVLGAFALWAGATLAHGRDLLDVWQLALERDPIYAASGYARQAGQERIPQARAGLLPYVSAQAAADVDDTRRARTLSGADSDTHAQWSLALVQPLFNLPGTHSSAPNSRSARPTSPTASPIRIFCCAPHRPISTCWPCKTACARS